MLLGAYSAHLELLQPRRGVPWASLMLDTQQCQLQESLQAPTRQVQQSLQVFTTPKAALEGDSHAKRKARLEPGGWFLFLQVPGSAGENQERGDKNSQQNWSPAKLSLSQPSSESQQMLLTPEAAARSHRHFQAQEQAFRTENPLKSGPFSESF